MADNGSGNNNHSTSAPSSKQGSNNAAANEIVRTFEALVRKSSRLFGSLRDLPQFGKFWSNHFQKTFEVYTKLWKYQQQYRNFLEDKEKYGLKRWEIGEIASKIGQLYYHYYLRTSDTNYLHESYIFYEALRTRAYFKDAMDSKIPDLMVKVMRFYARFIVVCLLLNRKRVVLELVDELSKHVDEYIKSLKPTDAQEWYLVLQEITTFLQADILVNANLQSSTQLSILPPRLEPSLMRNIVHSITASSANLTATNLSSNIPNITLQQAVLVGNHSHQIKFSELTLEMFRMMLALEFDPDWKEGSETERDKPEEGAPNSKRRNPHKYLLYRPTSAQLLMFIATAVKELHDGRALMVYISADGNVATQADGGIQRGLLMNTSRPPSSGSGVRVSAASNTNTNSSSSSIDVMYMIDFLPFTRRPLFMVIDSDASSIFKEMPNTFSQPLVCLLSPSAFPFPVSTTPRGVQKGNVFTLFLSDPISAFCVVTNIDKIQQQILEECTRTLQSTLEVICRAILSTPTVDTSFLSFMNDDFLRMFILRFVFCLATLSNHKQYSNSPSHIPTSRPDMAKEVLQNPQILAGVAKVAELLGVSDQFNLTS